MGALRLLGVDQPPGTDARVPGQSESCDEPATVMTDDRDVVQGESVHDPSYRFRVGGDVDAGGPVEATVTGTHEVEDVASKMWDKIGKEGAERGTTDRPSVHEEHVWPLPDTANRDLSMSHVDEAIWPGTEEVGCLRGGESRHRITPINIR